MKFHGSNLAARLVPLAAITLMACGGASAGPANTPAQTDVGSGGLVGAGATFVNPFFQAAFYAYNQKYSQVSVNYQSIGSGAGIQQFTQKTVDFGASDVPMTDSEVTAAGGASSLVQFPVALADEGIGYNLKEVSKLQLDATSLADIFLGKITKWNDAALQALNPGVSLPSKSITVVHRSDGSGTTYIFTDYLSNVSDEWKSKVGTGKSVNWPTGVGGKGNEGVGVQVQQTDGSIGYVELAYIVQSKLQMAYLKNKAGKYLQAGPDGAVAAAKQKPTISPADFSIVNGAGDSTYPISGYTWAFLRKSIPDDQKGRALVFLFKWIVTDGQQYGLSLLYAPLPKTISDEAITTLKTVQVNGKAVLS